MHTARARRAVIAMLLIMLCLPNRAAAQGTPTPAADDLIQVPIRWCALADAPVVTNPAALGEPDTDTALLHRLQRASDQVWLPGAHIVFRSAVPSGGTGPSYVKIADPIPPPAGKGQLGDLVGLDSGDRTEFDLAIAVCEAEWSARGILLGPIALAVRTFLPTPGTSAWAPGQTLPPVVGMTDGTTTPCPVPADVASVKNGVLGVADPSLLPVGVDDTTLLAHELGHLLNLRHGNGLDDNHDGAYDIGCDLFELSTSPVSLMDSAVGTATHVITDLQREEARAVAAKIEGAVVAPAVSDLIPTCFVRVPLELRDGPFVVDAANFQVTNEPVVIELGDERIADGTLDDVGAIVFELELPDPPPRPDPRLISVRVPDRALVAHCVFELVGSAD